METVILMVLLSGAVLYVLRHIKRLMIDGEQGNRCADCLGQTKKNPSKDKSPA